MTASAGLAGYMTGTKRRLLTTIFSLRKGRELLLLPTGYTYDKKQIKYRFPRTSKWILKKSCAKSSVAGRNTKYEHNFELFGNRISQKNPLNYSKSKTKGSYIYAGRRASRTFSQKTNNLPPIINDSICEKFKSIGTGITDKVLKDAYKSYVQKFIRENVRLLIFLTIKTTLDIYFARTRKEEKTKYAFAATVSDGNFLNFCRLLWQN